MRRAFGLATLALLAWGGTAAAEVVVYRQEGTGAGAVLVPRLTSIRTGRVLVERVSALFSELRRDKPQAYGNAALDLTAERATELERSKIVSVTLDADRPRTRDEVIGEMVYTFTAAGVVGVRAGIPGEAPRVYTRDDIATPAFVLSLPLWQGLPPSPFRGALVRLPGGRIATVEALEERLRAGDAALAKAVADLAGDPDVRRRLRAVRALGYLPEGLARPRLFRLLRDPDARLRGAAVLGLSSHKGAEVLKALERVLADDRDEEVRAAAARGLVQSGDRRAALAGIAFLLQSRDPERKVALLRELKADQLAGLGDALLPLLSDPSAKVRVAALGALAGRAEVKLLEAAEGVLDRDTDPEVRAAAARVLLQSGEPRFVARGLAHELAGSDEERAISAARQLGGLGALGREALEGALSRGAPAVRRAAAEALGRLADAKSLPALTRAARQGVVEARVAASGILAAQPVEKLTKLMTDEEALVRSLAVAAAAKAGGPAAQQAIAGAARDRDREVRLAVAEALGAISGEGAVASLSTLLEDEDERVRETAAESLGKLGDPAARPALLRLTKYGNAKVRRAVFRALSSLRDTPSREAVATLLESLYDDDAVVREHALLALSKADKKDRRVVQVVRLQLKDSAMEVRRASVIALGMLGDAKVISNLEDALTDEAAPVRAAAVDALGRVGGDAAAAALEKHSKVEKDPDIAAKARETAAKLK